MNERIEHQVGDVVLIHDPQLAAQMGRVDQVGVVVRRRRGGARVAYLPDRACYWIDDHRLYAHPDPQSAASDALHALSRALKILAAEEVELDVADDGALVAEIYCIKLDATCVDALRTELGPALVNWIVRPFGMAVFTIELRFA